MMSETKTETTKAVVLAALLLPLALSEDSSFMLSFISSRGEVVSREAKKKQQAHAYSSQWDHYSELFTRMVGLNF